MRFTVQKKVRYGEKVVLVGGHPSLGNWKVRKGAEMRWSEGDVWSAEVRLSPGDSVEFKCVKVGDDGGNESWEDGQNHVLSIPGAGAAQLAVQVDWGAELAVMEGGEAAPLLQSRGSGDWGTASAEVVPHARQRSPSPSNGYTSDSSTGAGAFTASSAFADMSRSSGSSFEERLPSEGWQGRETVFMQSNEHSRDRQGVWNTHGLQGALLSVVEGDRDNGSWLGKLGVVKHLLVDTAPRQRPDLDTLSAVYIYMQWIATGAVPCVESGGHQRPNRHAEIAKACFRSLEWVIEDAGNAARGGGHSSAAALGLVARRLHTRLPSFTEAFTQSVPLTRIRDIAHRNDIPSDLKREIKHTIQNKLHRNAGPEDLVATEAMLQRITAQQGEYSEAFVKEFKVFTAELRDFFNAASLSDMLAAVQSSMDEGSSKLLDRFLVSKAKLDDAGSGASQNDIVDALHGVTSVRALLAASLSSGLRNDAPDKALTMRQRYRLCEVRAEDYAFVLLSRFINTLEDKGGANGLAHGNDGGWSLPLGCLVLGLRHVGLSGFDPGECMALEQELGSWQKEGSLCLSKDHALRLRATLFRLQRLLEGYVALLMDSYTQRAQQLGGALGLDPYLITVFPEAEVRASVVFQLSKLCSMLLRATGMVAGGLDDWDVIVGGEARGVLVEVQELQPGCLEAGGGQPVVVVVREASGDEEVSALGPLLKGVVLKHAIPHLSHLGVRARQERVPFVCCEDEEMLQELITPLMGKQVKLSAGAEGATLVKDSTPLDSPSSLGGGPSFQAASAPAVQKVSGAMRVVPLEDATSATCGAKSAACGELLRLSKQCEEVLGRGGRRNGSTTGRLFQAPGGVCLPFGCMEVALEASGLMGEYEQLLSQLERAASASVSAELDGCCRQLEELISRVSVPQQVLDEIRGYFPPDSTLIARSSANVEDLAGMSGAGLYESVPNIPSGDNGALQEGVAAVWASLFTRRAVLSRKAAGVPQSYASMAVAIQGMLSPDLSFVLHTAHPITRDTALLQAELAPGLGETLAAGTRGSGWRLEIDKRSGKVTTRSFANFSRAFLPNGEPGASRGVSLQLVDYSQQPMSSSEEMRAEVGRRLTAVGQLLEEEFGGPQDVEGCFLGNDMPVAV